MVRESVGREVCREVYASRARAVGHARQGWRARIAHAEMLLAEALEHGASHGMGDGAKVRQAQRELQEMLDEVPS